MFKHYLKVAFRNLRKYTTQNIISIIGLAVGFTCFAFSTLWIRYEMSYDSFHSKADRIYKVNMALFKWNSIESGNSDLIQEGTPYPLGNWLKLNIPEIEETCGIWLTRPEPYHFLYLDQGFCKIFDLNLPEGFFIRGRSDQPIAVIPELNNEETVKFIKQLQYWDARIQATMPRWPANSNIQFNTAIPITHRFTDEQLNNWNMRMFDTYILTKKGVNIQALKEKLDKITIPEWPYPVSLVLTPLKQLRYNDPTGNIQSDIKFSHIQIFSIAGLLVILCSLFNHLTLYITRVRMRLRELALRKVNGASDGQITATLYIDFLLVILLSLIVGLLLIALLLPTFKEYANIGNSNIKIYTELVFYAVLLIVCGFVAGGIPILYFRKQVLSESIKVSSGFGYNNLIRKVILLVQLIISFGFMFCSAVFIKQIYFLQHTDLGIDRHNIAAVSAGSFPLTPSYANEIKQIPGIIDALPITENNFLRNMSDGTQTMDYEKDGKQGTYTYSCISADEHFFDFFGVEITDGVGFSNDTTMNGVYNETAVKELGDEVLSKGKFNKKVGVAQDFYLTPTTKAKPACIFYPGPKYDFFFRAIAYKYEEGKRQQTQQAVTQWLYKEFPGQGKFGINFTYMEDVFQEYFKSERALLKLLSVMTGACFLISIFGVYSLTSLSCQQRRKEIALRKINGAEVLDIMNIFFKESLVLLVIAAFFAFPVGYFIMEHWLQNYAKQTSMDVWLFVSIFLTIFIVVVLSTASVIWKAANQNPAKVVKNE